LICEWFSYRGSTKLNGDCFPLPYDQPRSNAA
jgi:hypothetical protein